MAKAETLTGRVALDDVALAVDADEVGGPDLAEVHAERIDPERIGELRVARRDVAGDALAEAEGGEDPEAAGEALLAVLALLGERREGGGTSGRRSGRRRSAWRGRGDRLRGSCRAGSWRLSLSPAGRDGRVGRSGVPMLTEAWERVPKRR